jgi:hypothetical protein
VDLARRNYASLAGMAPSSPRPVAALFLTNNKIAAQISVTDCMLAGLGPIARIEDVPTRAAQSRVCSELGWGRLVEQTVLEFVGQTFRSIWPVELLLTLYQRPDQRWPFDTLVGEIRASRSIVHDALQSLLAAGFIVIDPDGLYRYQPDSPEREDMARAVIDLYNRKPRAVMRSIFPAPRDRIRTFTDAFRLRKDPC